MCFKDKNGYKIIQSKVYIGLYSNRICPLFKKKYDRELVFEVDNSKGKVDFLLENKNSKEINYIENVENGSHTFILEKNSSYTLKVKFIGCNGKYKIKLKRMKL